MAMGRQLVVAVMAAGRGTRMKSQVPKVLHKVGSLTILERVLRTVQSLDPVRCLLIVGYGQEQVRRLVEAQFAQIEFVEQRQQRGTGHAVQQVIPYLEGFEGEGFEGDLLVVNGDVPLLRPETLADLITQYREQATTAAVLTAQVPDPTGYGRVFCDHRQRILNIVEHRDCSPEQRLHRRINAGIYCFDWGSLAQVLPQLTSANSQGEYYITDAVGLLDPVLAVDVIESRGESSLEEIGGINDRIQLATAEGILQRRWRRQWMQAGVTLIEPESITFDDQVHLDPDVIIEPQTHLRGATQIGSGSHLGPGCWIADSLIGPNCRVLFSTVTNSQIAAGSTVGPYTHLRQQTQVGEHCRIGNFVELKKTSLGSHTNAAHLSYLGDATLADHVNIGAGTITANYDGSQKHPTQIGSHTKTGSNSVLVAPIKLGSHVTVAAGSTVTEDVPDDCLVIARTRQVIKPGWQPKPPKPKDPSPAGSTPTAQDPAKDSAKDPMFVQTPIRIHALRLVPGQDLRIELQQFSQATGLQAGFVITAVGSLSQASLRWANQTQTTLWPGDFEIISLTGSLCPDGVHLHMAIADPQGQVWGGHLTPGNIIRTTAEIVLGDSLQHRFCRQMDPVTGYPELGIERIL